MWSKFNIQRIYWFRLPRVSEAYSILILPRVAEKAVAISHGNFVNGETSWTALFSVVRVPLDQIGH